MMPRSWPGVRFGCRNIEDGGAWSLRAHQRLQDYLALEPHRILGFTLMQFHSWHSQGTISLMQ